MSMKKFKKYGKKMEFKCPKTKKSLAIREDGFGSILSVSYDGKDVPGKTLTAPGKLNGREIIYISPGAMIVTVASPACVIKYDPITKQIRKYCPPGETC